MTRTTEHLLTWAPLGAGLAFILSGHRRIGFLVGLVSPATVAILHPGATRRTLQAVPSAVADAGKASGKAMSEVGKQAGKGITRAGRGLRWMAS